MLMLVLRHSPPPKQCHRFENRFCFFNVLDATNNMQTSMEKKYSRKKSELYLQENQIALTEANERQRKLTKLNIN